MSKSLKQKTIFLIALSSILGCKSKEVVQVQTLNIKDNLVNHREVIFDNKKCSMSSKFVLTENLGSNQQGLICLTPSEFNKGFVRWKTECQK
jgi:hypothetical protein